MKSEQAHVTRLWRLEKVRSIARQSAVQNAADAESVLAQLHDLAARTRRIAEDYTSRRDMADGSDLQRIGSFVSGLQVIAGSTACDAHRAKAIADARQSDLSAAERRRAAAEDRARRAEGALAKSAEKPVLVGKKSSAAGFGTDREKR